MEEAERYFLSQDNDCHWYIIPNKNREEWREWVDNVDEDDPKSWDAPDFAKTISGGASSITFLDPSSYDKNKEK